MRYYVGLFSFLLILSLALGLVQVTQWWGKVDTTISLKELNQRIAPIAISCPKPYYPKGTEVVCLVEAPTARSSVVMAVSEDAIDFRDPESAQTLMGSLLQ